MPCSGSDYERLKQEHQIYSDLARTLTSTLDLSEVLRIIMEKVETLLKPRSWSLLLMEEDGRHLHFEIAVGPSAQTLAGSRLSVGEGIAGWVAQNGRSVLLEDASADERFCSRFDEASRFTTRSIICVPMKIGERVVGVIELINRMEETAFTDLDMRALETLAEYGAIAIQNAALFDRAQRLVITDDHTSLYNCRHLYDTLDQELARARLSGHEVAMVFFDLDHFKRVNDTHGHLRGSKVLREVGHLLRRQERPGVIPFRYGGDEFVVLLPGSSKDEGLAFAGNLRRLINETTFLADEGIDLHITASFGVASYPGDASDQVGLLGYADIAMYRVKESTRDAIAAA
ncbi:MAG: sensor domain-containing diguanylate cyclase [Syntrophobacteraceae bacterium]|jgi:diguanylate cyclase (GGDEF)-like protein|nr:sensor domain-containing diguanylate cyclase [Syntrophobacteraceae bacterium]